MNLAKNTIDILQGEEKEWSNDPGLDEKYLLLCRKVKEHEDQQLGHQVQEVFFDGLCDLPDESTSTYQSRNHIAVSIDDSDNGNFNKCNLTSREAPQGMECATSTIDPTSLTTQLMRILKSGNASVREIVDLVSIVKDDELKTALINTWKKLTKRDEKIQFIEMLSAHPSSSVIVCRDILLPELKSEDRFCPTMEIASPALHLLQTNAISNLFIPLLIDKDSFISGETNRLKDILQPLSQSQKTDFLSCFIEIMEDDIKKDHLQILAVLLEDIPLNDATVSKIVMLFSRNVTLHSADRNFGKIILIALESCNSGTTANIIKELTHISSLYKGVMRFRINGALKKLIS